jgi:transporter family protein
VGSAVLTYGCLAFIATDAKGLTPAGGLFAFGMGLTWSTAILCMSYGISVLNIPVSIIAPLTNSNALVAVLFSAIIFAEWKDLNFTKVLCGTALVVLGATIVSTSIGKG